MLFYMFMSYISRYYLFSTFVGDALTLIKQQINNYQHILT
jgi:hypothetical protein